MRDNIIFHPGLDFGWYYLLSNCKEGSCKGKEKCAQLWTAWEHTKSRDTEAIKQIQQIFDVVSQ